jgi:hypothetical protein
MPRFIEYINTRVQSVIFFKMATCLTNRASTVCTADLPSFRPRKLSSLDGQDMAYGGFFQCHT